MMKPKYFLFFSLILFSFVNAQAALNTQRETIPINVSAGQTATIMIYLYDGDAISGTISVSRGQGDVFFYVKDTYGKETLPMKKIQDNGTFAFVSVNTSVYAFTFDNAFSNSDKDIILYYTVLHSKPMSTAPKSNSGYCRFGFIIPMPLVAALLLRWQNR